MEGTRIVLIRHGESAAQEGGFVAGHAGCTGLSPHGRNQAAALRDRLAMSRELDGTVALYASEMRRSQETAEIIAPALPQLDLRTECDLCEIHPDPDADGLDWDAFVEKYPRAGEWDPDSRWAPGDETWNEMAERVKRGLDRLVEAHRGETLVVACHGGVIVHSLIRFLQLSIRPVDGDRAWFHPVNTSLTEWAYGEMPFGPQRAGWQLVRFNDHAHLAGAAAPDP